jgi:Mrp family chromosome partitioning ATPase
MDIFITEAKLHYDIIIIDTPPIGYVADYFVLLKYFDINIFVVRFNYTNKNILYGINDVYKNNKVKNMNILFNDVKLSPGYGYGYLDGYGQGYYSDKSSQAKPEKQTSRIKKLFFF